MTSDEIWDLISKIKRDPCAPKDHHIVTNNPYTIDKWKNSKKHLSDDDRSRANAPTKMRQRNH